MVAKDSHVDESIAFFSMEKFNRAAAMLNSVVATVLLIVSIVVLYVVSRDSVRLGLICFFTVLFAVSVKTLTNARRAEVFASTAAYVMRSRSENDADKLQIRSGTRGIREWESGIVVLV